MKNNRIPLVVGVTGHRDLREIDRAHLEDKVREILSGFRAAYPSTPRVLLSSLAEGADRLVARVALTCDYELIVPFPFPVEIYRRDFTAAASQQEFAGLLARAVASFAVPFDDGITAENLDTSSHRERQYALAGEYVLRHSHVLLALWDGHDSAKEGGTSQVVRQKLAGFPLAVRPEWSVVTPPDAGAVFQVVTPRQSRPDLAGAYRLREYYLDPRYPQGSDDDKRGPGDLGRKIFLSLLERTNAFNADLDRFEPAGDFPPQLDPAAQAGASALGPDLQILRSRFAAADGMAAHFQKKRRRSLILLFILALESPVCLAAYDSTEGNLKNGLLCLCGFFFCVFLALLIFFRAKRGLFETKHLDYRALAEGLKILFFWRVAGIRDDVAVQYLRKQRSEVDWIRLAVRASDLLTSQCAAPAESYAWIKTAWLEHQVRYFKKSAVACRKSYEQWTWGAALFVILGVTLAGMILVAGLTLRDDFPTRFGAWARGLSVLIVFLLAAGGSCAAYAERLAFNQQAKQYRQMHALFTLAVRECDACLERGEAAPVRTLLRRLGQEALRENGDWVLLHRERPMELRFSP